MTIRNVWQRVGTISLCTLVLAIGCSDGEQSPPSPAPTAGPVAEISVPLLFTPETKDFADSASDAFNKVRNTLGDGAVIKLTPVSATTMGMHTFLGQHPKESFLWIAPSTLELKRAKVQLEQEGGEQSSCESLFFTAPAFVYRPLDSFAFGSEDRATNLSLFLEQDQRSNIPEATLATGHPVLSPSGLAALIMLGSAATGVSYPELGTDALAAHSARLQGLARRTIHQFADDQVMLDWLTSREGGVPILALTTRQQLRRFAKRFPGAQISESVVPVSPFDLDFPLCIIESPHSLPRSQQAARLARGFLMSAHVTPLIEAAGFSERRPGRPASEQISPSSLEGLLNSRNNLQRESWTSLILDTSMTVERSLLDSARKLLSQKLRETTTLPFSTSVMSCSTTPELLVRSTNNPKTAVEALDKLRVSGGFAFGDCVLQALEFASEPDIRDKGKTIIVLTRGRETSTVTALNELKQRIPRHLNRTQTVLYVVSIADSPGENAAFEAHARALGAVVVPTTPRTFSDTITALLAELS
jgi:hypothetical protein